MSAPRLEGLGCGPLEVQVRLEAEGPCEVQWAARPHEGGLLVEGALLASGEVRLQDIYFDIKILEQKITPRWRFFRHGYASWTPSASFALDAPPRRPWSGSFAVANHPVDSRPWRDRRAMVGHGFGVLGPPEQALFVGHLACTVGLSVVAYTGEGRLLAGLDYGGKRLRAGERLALEPLWLCWGPPAEALERWVEAVAARAGLGPLERPSPVGWCSWYHFYTSVTDADMVRNAEALRALPELGVRVVQLDDGYQTAVGDWRSLNGKFPRGLGPMVEDIRARGFEAGLWTAPFYVGRRSRLFREHPDWVLRDGRGRAIDCGVNPAWRDRLVGLDLSHLEALGWLRQTFEALRAEGFRFFKLDFLYAALRTAQAFDPGLSPVERYRLGLRVIAEAVGPDGFLLGCGAPILPSVGLVHGMRVSADVKERWAPGPLGWLGADCGAPSLLESARNNLTRAAFHRRFWLNDPDCLLVRDRQTSLDDHEVGLLAAVAGMTGGLGLLSDDLAAVSEPRLALLRRVLPPHQGRPSAPDLFERPFPETFVLEGAGRRLRLHLNWGPGPREVRLDGANWSFDALGLRLLEEAVSVPRHGALGVWETPRAEHPRLVGAELPLGALTDGALVDRWEPEAGTLHLEGGAPGPSRAWIAAPAGWRPVSGRAVELAPGLWQAQRPEQGPWALGFQLTP